MDDLEAKLKLVYDSEGMAGVDRIAMGNINAQENDSIYRMSQLPKIKPQQVYKLGMATLDDHYRIRRGDFTVITGIPSHGKSTFINAVASQMAFNHDWTTCFASFEQQPQIDHRRALRTIYNRKLEVQQSEEELDRADRWIDRYFSFIVPRENEMVSLDYTLEAAHASVIRHKASLVVIDPWNEMDHVREHGESLTEYVGYAIKQFRAFARSLDVHVIVAAHPAKMVKNKDTGAYSAPTLYDISDSAHWYNKADCGIVIHRKSETVTTIRVAKSRYHDQIGTPGDVEACFSRETGRYLIEEPEMSTNSMGYKD